jgi:hypothetical protein
MGQTRSFGDVGSMSGLPPKADLNASSRHVAQVPIADITCVERPQRAEVRDAGVAVNGHE